MSGGAQCGPFLPCLWGFPQAFPSQRGVALSSEPSPLCWLGCRCRGSPFPMALMRSGSRSVLPLLWGPRSEQCSGEQGVLLRRGA